MYPHERKDLPKEAVAYKKYLDFPLTDAEIVLKYSFWVSGLIGVTSIVIFGLMSPLILTYEADIETKVILAAVHLPLLFVGFLYFSTFVRSLRKGFVGIAAYGSGVYVRSVHEDRMLFVPWSLVEEVDEVLSLMTTMAGAGRYSGIGFFIGGSEPYRIVVSNFGLVFNRESIEKLKALHARYTQASTLGST